MPAIAESIFFSHETMYVRIWIVSPLKISKRTLTSSSLLCSSSLSSYILSWIHFYCWKSCRIISFGSIILIGWLAMQAYAWIIVVGQSLSPGPKAVSVFLDIILNRPLGTKSKARNFHTRAQPGLKISMLDPSLQVMEHWILNPVGAGFWPAQLHNYYFPPQNVYTHHITSRSVDSTMKSCNPIWYVVTLFDML